MEDLSREKTLEKDLQDCRNVAYGSAIIGVFILLMYLVFRRDGIVWVGCFYLFVALVFNCLMLLIPLFWLFKTNEYWKRIFITIAIMLANIPLGIICAIIGSRLLED